MAASGSQTMPTLGFFTVTEDAEWGIVGGLLVLNAAGRPLEFHCTAPLKPNRAQEILYGPTLRPFLYGEQIGATLAAKAKSTALFLCTDSEPALCLRHVIETPLLFVTDPGTTAGEQGEPRGAGASGKNFRLDAAHDRPAPHAARLKHFQLGQQPVAVLEQFESDQQLIAERFTPYQSQIDLWEPFSRIREALLEAQRGASK